MVPLPFLVFVPFLLLPFSLAADGDTTLVVDDDEAVGLANISVESARSISSSACFNSTLACCASVNHACISRRIPNHSMMA
jgi:hypothetical protein